ncbi:hypothetical protein [Desulfobacula phenolica]|uniref:hypothetical protein n=1 Tax=Desulfobacula phenolica TaxID=90732 RepID=UPI0015870DDC|nr:hypothetical protein [Desulfobacula phenolica]
MDPGKAFGFGLLNKKPASNHSKRRRNFYPARENDKNSSRINRAGATPGLNFLPYFLFIDLKFLVSF